MKKLFLILPIIMIIGCAPNAVVETPEPEIAVEEIKKQLKEEIKEEVKEEIKQEETEKEPELTLETYDYKTDPDTLVVNINEDNLSEYVDVRIVQRSDGKYCIRTHSLMYDKGYVVVGYENCFFSMRSVGYEMEGKIYHMADDPGNTTLSDNPFIIEVAHSFTTEESAKEFLKDINEYYPHFESDKATIYYQKLEDVKFGYEITDDGVRTVNGEKTFCFANCPY